MTPAVENNGKGETPRPELQDALNEIELLNPGEKEFIAGAFDVAVKNAPNSVEAGVISFQIGQKLGIYPDGNSNG